MAVQKSQPPRTEDVDPLEALQNDDQVIHHKNEKAGEKWTFTPRIRVKPGTDLMEMLERHPRRSFDKE